MQMHADMVWYGGPAVGAGQDRVVVNTPGRQPVEWGWEVRPAPVHVPWSSVSAPYISVS
ncbi:hypothetical protein JB92DRAFT_2972841, partial [Gautieria morchelliformis]